MQLGRSPPVTEFAFWHGDLRVDLFGSRKNARRVRFPHRRRHFAGFAQLQGGRAERRRAREAGAFTIYLVTASPDPLPVTSINQRYRGFASALITIMIPRAHTRDKDPNTDAAAPRPRDVQPFGYLPGPWVTGHYQVVISPTKSPRHSPPRPAASPSSSSSSYLSPRHLSWPPRSFIWFVASCTGCRREDIGP